MTRNALVSMKSFALAVWLGCALCEDLSANALQSEGHTLEVEGLTQPVEVLRDRWGIAHIYARNEADLFFAQGYNVASDRLFQLELWRMQATGTAAQALGRGELQRDIGARLHLFRGDLSRELSFYHPRGEAIVAAFVRGVNAYIARTESEPELLPIEFRLLGLKPGRWTPQVVVSRHQGLLGNINMEVALARSVPKVGADRLRQLIDFQGGDPVLTADAALDLTTLPRDVLQLYNAFRTPLTFSPRQILGAHRNDHTSYERLAALRAGARANVNPRNIGSNNWVIHGSRTTSSYPILANDPHRSLTSPSVRYWVHLVAPGWNVIGAGEPALPGVSIGHNEYGAWGLTVFGNDSEDLYVYETNPANPNEYRYRNQWEPLRILRDTIEIKGGRPVHVEYKYTRHGPVLFEDTARRRIYALRAGWLEIGGAPYLASLRMMQAHTWEEFREACTFNHIPAENMVWADRKGNIGYQASGLQPLRHNWSGLLPVPGDGSYEWDGHLPIKALPHDHNPVRGFIATANQYLMPIDYAWPEAMHYWWADPYRGARISEVLGSGRMFSVADVMQLQNDVLSIPARQLVPLLEGIALSRSSSRDAREHLLDWDFVMEKRSVAAGIYAMWQERLQENFRKLVLRQHSLPALAWSMSMKRLIEQVLAPNGDFGVDPIAGRDALLARSLDEAVAELTKRFGPDMSAWRYGQEKYHYVVIRHPLSAAVDETLRSKLDVGVAARGGDGYTVNFTPPIDGQEIGGSFKIIVDTQNWDNSVGQNTPGQSGDPDSPHYRDLFRMWAQGKYFPVAYSRRMVESVTEQRLILQPARHGDTGNESTLQTP